MSEKPVGSDQGGVYRSYFHGPISKEEAITRVESAQRDGSFLLRSSATQANLYSITARCEITVILYFLFMPRLPITQMLV